MGDPGEAVRHDRSRARPGVGDAGELRKDDMNIYELHRDATPRPDNPGYCDRRTRSLRRYVNHAYDNFMEALLTVKKCRSILDSEYPKQDPRHPSQWLDKKIEDLEEVES